MLGQAWRNTGEGDSVGQPKPKDKWRQSGQPSAPQQSVYDDVGQMRLKRHEVGNMWSERTVRTVSASQGGNEMEHVAQKQS